MTASLAEQKRMTDVVGLKADPPRIVISTTPAILVQTDGEAAYAPVKGRAGLSFAVNTNWDLFRIDEGGALYLRDDTHWLTASAIGGPLDRSDRASPAADEPSGRRLGRCPRGSSAGGL